MLIIIMLNYQLKDTKVSVKLTKSDAEKHVISEIFIYVILIHFSAK